jgi:uncharacterized lipoprotein YmbA
MRSLSSALFVVILLSACASSSAPTSTTGSDDAPADRTVYAEGWVITPDSTRVPNAVVETKPLVVYKRTDADGRFRIYEPLPDDEYTFIGRRAGDNEIEGRTRIQTEDGKIKEPFHIVLGRDLILRPEKIDSVRASPTGPGHKRSGGE